MVKSFRAVAAAAVALLLVVGGCKSESESAADAEPFAFVVYPAARYLGPLTEVTKKAHALAKPSEPPPPLVIYDTEAPLEIVANYYAKEYGYGVIAPDNVSLASPLAYYRTGELFGDVKAVEPLFGKLNLTVDTSKAKGAYRAVEVGGKPNRPRVTLQRPYFDVTSSEVVDRTLILMSR